MTTAPSTTPRLWIALAAVVALAAVAAAWWWLPTGEDDSTSPTSPPTTAQACGPVQREPVDGAGSHVPDATYDAAPPAFGDHAPRWEVRATSFYDVEDRPEVSVLVHNLEHGYNILWYDQSVVDGAEAVDRLREIADAYGSLGGAPDPDTAFIAAPWTAADGAEFPEGTPYALTHWYADPTDRTGSRDDEEGLTRYCSEMSAEIVEDWMTEFPLRDAPEGFPDLM